MAVSRVSGRSRSRSLGESLTGLTIGISAIALGILSILFFETVPNLDLTLRGPTPWAFVIQTLLSSRPRSVTVLLGLAIEDAKRGKAPNPNWTRSHFCNGLLSYRSCRSCRRLRDSPRTLRPQANRIESLGFIWKSFLRSGSEIYPRFFEFIKCLLVRRGSIRTDDKRIL